MVLIPYECGCAGGWTGGWTVSQQAGETRHYASLGTTLHWWLDGYWLVLSYHYYYFFYIILDLSLIGAFICYILDLVTHDYIYFNVIKDLILISFSHLPFHNAMNVICYLFKLFQVILNYFVILSYSSYFELFSYFESF